MKKLAIMMTVVATLLSNGAYAQARRPTTTGSGAQAGTYSSNDGMAWGVGLVGLAIVGTVVGVTVASAVSSQSSFSH